MGNNAAITVNVAMIVGVPTSSTAAGTTSRKFMPPAALKRLEMFSTITMASSTKMPIAKISANNDTRLSVNPHAQEKTSVTNNVTMTEQPTMVACRQPMPAKTSNITDRVAITKSVMSFRDLSPAVLP